MSVPSRSKRKVRKRTMGAPALGEGPPACTQKVIRAQIELAASADSGEISPDVRHAGPFKRARAGPNGGSRARSFAGGALEAGNGECPVGGRRPEGQALRRPAEGR